MRYTVIIRDLAQADIEDLYDWVEAAAGTVTAERYLDRIDSRIATLETLPHRGSPRNALRPGLRALSFEGRMLIYYTIDGENVFVMRVVSTARDQPPLFDA